MWIKQAGLAGFFLATFSATPAQAWYKHQALMPLLLESKFLKGAKVLATPMAPSCGRDYVTIASALAQSLELNPAFESAPSPFALACQAQRTMTGAEILSGTSIDDPDDSGMDENLPRTADPGDDRHWLGGPTGPASKTFRHVYYGGWTPFHPLVSFQLPGRVLGVAPARVAAIGRAARIAFRAGPAYTAWGYRMVAWALHYIQDLTQPFHTSQDLTPLIVPWEALLHWPNAHLREETERVVDNYHWALEGYVLERARASSDATWPAATRPESPWDECLMDPAAFWTMPTDVAGAAALPKSRNADEREAAKTRQLEQVSHSIAEISRNQAGKLGARAVRFFGRELMAPGASLPQGTAHVDYAALAIRPDLEKERRELHEAVCQSLANTAWATNWLLQWVFEP